MGPASHCNPACPESDPCDPTCPGRECLLLCGPGACDPAVCPTAACSPLCTAINGGACNPACPTSPCEEVCGGNPCHDDCPSAACNPICDPNPCNPDCCTFDDGNPCTRDCCQAGNLCVTDDLAQPCAIDFPGIMEPVKVCPGGSVIVEGVVCNIGGCPTPEPYTLSAGPIQAGGSPPGEVPEGVTVTIDPPNLTLAADACGPFQVTILADATVPPNTAIAIPIQALGTFVGNCGEPEPCVTQDLTLLLPSYKTVEVRYSTFISPEVI